jgi:hypothetical protein
MSGIIIKNDDNVVVNLKAREFSLCSEREMKY